MQDKLLRRPRVEAVTGLSRSAIYDQIAKGLFPRPVRLTAKAVGWRESELKAWVESRKKA